MSEICLECFNKGLLEDKMKPITKKDVILSYDLCEICGEIKPCIVRYKLKNILKDYFNL